MGKRFQMRRSDFLALSNSAGPGDLGMDSSANWMVEKVKPTSSTVERNQVSVKSNHPLHSYINAVLFQVADEHIGDADVNGEGRECPPKRRIVGGKGVDSAIDQLVQDISRQGVLTEVAKESNLPASQIRHE